MDILDTAGLPNTKRANLVFGADMYTQGQVKENVKIPYVLFSSWKPYTPLLSLPHLALPCLASSQPPSLGDKKQDKTKSWPICRPPPWPQGGNTVLCSNSPFPMSASQTRTPAFVTIQNRENPWVIPYLIMAVSRKTSNTDISTPAPVFTVGSGGTGSPRAFPCNGDSWKADVLLPWVSTCCSLLGRDIPPYGNLSPDRHGVNSFHGYAFLSHPMTTKIQAPVPRQLLSVVPWRMEEVYRSICLSCVQNSAKTDGQKRKLESVVFLFHLASDSFGTGVSELKIKT